MSVRWVVVDQRGFPTWLDRFRPDARLVRRRFRFGASCAASSPTTTDSQYVSMLVYASRCYSGTLLRPRGLVDIAFSGPEMQWPRRFKAALGSLTKTRCYLMLYTALKVT